MKPKYENSTDRSRPLSELLPDLPQEQYQLLEEIMRAEAQTVKYKLEEEFRAALGEIVKTFQMNIRNEMSLESLRIREHLEKISNEIIALSQQIHAMINNPNIKPNETLIELMERVEALEQTVFNARHSKPSKP